MSVIKGNAPIKGLGKRELVKNWVEEPYEAHMVLLAQEFELLPESIKAMVNECSLCYGDGVAYFRHPVYATLEEKPCPNQCYLRNGS